MAKKDMVTKLAKAAPKNEPQLKTFQLTCFEMETFRAVMNMQPVGNSTLGQIVTMDKVVGKLEQGLEPHKTLVPPVVQPIAPDAPKEEREAFERTMASQQKLLEKYWDCSSEVSLTPAEYDVLRFRMASHRGFNTSPGIRPRIIQMAKKLDIYDTTETKVL